MNASRVFVTGAGIVSPVGCGLGSVLEALAGDKSTFTTLSLFEPGDTKPFLVGQVTASLPKDDVPRTHQLAWMATQEALVSSQTPPDAVVLGTTTGGMLLTEELIINHERDRRAFSWHGAGAVAQWIARRIGCKGPALTISTACSSSAASLHIAALLLRLGLFRKVLAGGADSLCRLTYHGFGMLKLLDAKGARPLDQDRAGMTISEGSAMLLLEAAASPPPEALGELLGGGLSCDAHHPTAPHPQGLGAALAMRKALKDSGLSPDQIDYLNLHGTGTQDNDASEAKAILEVFGSRPPPLSSTKGTFGHPLAAAGAIEAVVTLTALQNELLPGNQGCQTPDPELGLQPILSKTSSKTLRQAISNSFGFGGNNACLVFGKIHELRPAPRRHSMSELRVLGLSCVTGAGDLKNTYDNFVNNRSCVGCHAEEHLTPGLPSSLIRRMKRLPRMALALAQGAVSTSAALAPPSQIVFSTGWGPLSESFSFLQELLSSDKRLASPSDFVGSVHNAPAGHVAKYFQATGANLTVTGGDTSFEQGLLMASLLASVDKTPLMLVGADEFHSTYSPLFDASAASANQANDGGGSMLLSSSTEQGIRISLRYLSDGMPQAELISQLIEALGGAERIRSEFGAILAGIPLKCRVQGDTLLRQFLQETGFSAPVMDYRRILGEQASASACACALAVHLLQQDSIPASIFVPSPNNNGGVLVMNFADSLAAVEVRR